MDFNTFLNIISMILTGFCLGFGGKIGINLAVFFIQILTKNEGL